MENDLISRSALLQVCDAYITRMVNRRDIVKAPAIDAVPVVRCKNCKQWGITGVPGETEHIKCCRFGQYMVGENGYCVYGERKDGA